MVKINQRTKKYARIALIIAAMTMLLFNLLFSYYGLISAIEWIIRITALEFLSVIILLIWLVKYRFGEIRIRGI